MNSKNKENASAKMLTETELELMSIIWKLGEGSVAEVIGKLQPERRLAYTSVSTILRILEQKNVLATRKEGRGHIYLPILTKDEYESRTIKHVVEKVFDGTAVSMVRQLLTTVNLTEKDISEIKKMIAGKGREK